MTDTRIMPCSVCGGDGGFDVPTGYYNHINGDLITHWHECPACLGSGEVEIDMEPVEESDVSTLPSHPSSSDGGR